MTWSQSPHTYPPLCHKKRRISEETSNGPCWSSLPKKYLSMIADHLNAIDHANFRSVCSSWRASSYKRPKIPLIIMGNYNKHGVQTICFFDTEVNHMIINLSKFTIQFGSYFCGSSLGWLAFFSQPFLRISLQNPITGARIMLPRTDVYCDTGFDEPIPIKAMLYPIEVRKFGLLNSLPAKAVLSGPPTDPHCIIAVIWRHCRRVDFCKVKDNGWKIIEYFFGRIVFQDLLFYKGQLYLSYKANIFRLDMEANKGEGEIILVARARSMEFGRIKMSFLVEFCGDLLLILRFHIGDCKYKLWKVNLEKNRLELLQDQGERVVFLGHSGSVGMPPMSLLGSRPDSFFRKELFNMFQSDCNVFDVYDHYGDMNLKLKEYEVDIDIWEPISWFQPCLQ